MPITAIAAPIITKVFGELYAIGKEKYQKHLYALSTQKASESLYRKIASLEKVKTIWQIDKAVNLRRFFYPCSVIFSERKIQLDNLSQLKKEDNYVLQGTIGQGKSTFLRYLCIKELEKGDRFPLFVEFRRLGKDNSLSFFLRKSLEALGLKNVTEEVFEFLADSGKLVLLLDAFDELQPDRIGELITEIEHLIEMHPEMQVVITSRPSSGIEHSAKLQVIQLAPLNKSDHEGFLKKIMPIKSERDELLESIKKSTTEISGLITTPLMLTLLVLAYRSDNVIPRIVSEFYERLFITLTSRHDKTKPGYVRHRYSKLGDKDLQILFEAFCFISRNITVGEINDDNLHEMLKKACTFTRVQCSDDEFKNEMTKIACLMIEEGHKLYFIHKSVQEYYASMYIKRSSDSFASIFYKRRLRPTTTENWEQELVFLGQIDQHRFDKYFFIPAVIDLFEFIGLWKKNKVSRLTKKAVMHICESFQVEFLPTPEPSGRASIALVSWRGDGLPYHLGHIQSRVSTAILHYAQEVGDGSKIQPFTYKHLSNMAHKMSGNNMAFSFKQLAANEAFFESIKSHINNYLKKLNDGLAERTEIVRIEEEKAKELLNYSIGEEF